MKEIRVYRDRNGKEPFTVWLKKLKDKKTQSRISKRILDAANGNFGDNRYLGDGLIELKFHFGKGYRVYFADFQEAIILIINGGTKNTEKEQNKDIEQARKLLQDFLGR